MKTIIWNRGSQMSKGVRGNRCPVRKRVEGECVPPVNSFTNAGCEHTPHPQSEGLKPAFSTPLLVPAGACRNNWGKGRNAARVDRPSVSQGDLCGFGAQLRGMHFVVGRHV